MKSWVLAGIGVFFLAASAGAEDRLPARVGGKAGSASGSMSGGQTKLICKTAGDKRAPGQALKLYFRYNLPLVYEPEDPTMPFGRQILLLAGRPAVQLFFEKSAGPAGESGELLQPMQCAFARRALRAGEPSQAQILQPLNQVTWLSQPLGQRPPNRAEQVTATPTGDWAFASQYEQVFTLELDDGKNFVTAQQPKPL